MSIFTGKLDQLEAKLQTFIEGKLSRLSPIPGGYEELSQQLVSALQDGTISKGDGSLLAPDRFTLLVHPSKLEALSEDPGLMAVLAELIRSEGNSVGLHFDKPPVVTISPNEDVPINGIDIIVRISDQAQGHTTSLENASTDKVHKLPSNAFLIVNGVEVFPLEQTVINIGRSRSNHLAVEDQRVSRQHAQIRATHGRYEIFDLDSTGGTFINQKRITQSLLHPGDVISLAGVRLIYGQEKPSSLSDTTKLTTTENLGKIVE